MVRLVHALLATTVLAAAVVGGTSDVCVGATYTWTGLGTNWFDPAGSDTLSSNWDAPADTLLLSTDSLVFGGNSPLSPDQNTTVQIANLTFSGGSSYTLFSTALRGLTISGTLLQDSTSSQLIANSVVFVTGAVVDTQRGDLTLLVLDGSGSFEKKGSYALTLTNAREYSGTITISSGSVSTSDVGNDFGGSIVNNGGLFSGSQVFGSYVQTSGTGLFNSADSVNQTGGTIMFSTGWVEQDSTLSGVNSITGATGVAMTFNSNLTLGSGNITTFDLAAGGSADEYVVNGLLTYGGSMTLNFTTSGSAGIGTTWSVFDPTGGVAGTFVGIGGSGVGPYASLEWGLATSSTNVFDQRYGEGIWLSGWTNSGTSSQRLVFNQHTGDMTVVPEPSTFVMAAAGVAGWGLMRYRRRSRATAAAKAVEAA